MNGLVALVARHGVLLVAANVFVEQLGLPVPAYPLFVVAGALAVRGVVNGPLVLLAVLAAAVVADTVWFLLGRRFGTRVLRVVCGLSLSPDTCVAQTASAFHRHGLRALLVAKFVPGLSAVAVPASGALGASFGRFLLFDTAGAFVWAGSGLGLGAVFHRQVDETLRLLSLFGSRAVALLAFGLVLYIAARLVVRQRSLSAFRMSRIGPEELAERLAAGDGAVVVLDVRSRLARRSDPYKVPGAVVADLGELDGALQDVPAGKDVAVYCT